MAVAKDASGGKAIMGREAYLGGLIGYQQDAIVSRTLVDKSAGTVTLFAFDAGQGLSEHTAPCDAMVCLIEGRLRITIAGADHDLSAGQTIIMPANVPHAVSAPERAKMLLIMIRA